MCLILNEKPLSALSHSDLKLSSQEDEVMTQSLLSKDLNKLSL